MNNAVIIPLFFLDTARVKSFCFSLRKLLKQDGEFLIVIPWIGECDNFEVLESFIINNKKTLPK